MLWNKTLGTNGVREFLTLVDSGTAAAPSTLTNNITISLGAEFTNRHVIVCISTYRGASGRHITSLSLSGTALTFNANATVSLTGLSTQALIASCIKNTGTSGSLTITTTGEVSYFGYFVFVANNTSQTALSSSTALLQSNSTNQTAAFNSFNAGSYAIIYGQAGYKASAPSTIIYSNAVEAGTVLIVSGSSQMLASAGTVDPNKGTLDVSLTALTTHNGPSVAIASWDV